MAILTSYWGSDGIFILFCVIFGFYWYSMRNFNYWQNRGVKTASPIAIFGNFATIIFAKKLTVKLLQEIYEMGRSEPYIGFYALDMPYLMIRDPELIKSVLIKDFNNFPDRINKCHRSDVVGNMNLFLVKSPEWRYIRQKLSPVFTTGRLKKMFELMLDVDKDLDTCLKSLKLEGPI